MSRHDGVSCDSCLSNNFKGRRYKCLVCYDYDLCGTCYETGATSARHASSHAMQCMLPRAEYELYYGGEPNSISSEQPLSLTCPYCARMGLTETSLYEHLCSDHSDSTVEVVCPICSSLPGGEPNNVVMDLMSHVQREHRSSQDHATHHHALTDSALVVDTTVTNSASSTTRQQPRRMAQRGTSGSNGTLVNGVGSGVGGTGMGRGYRRPQMQFASVPISPRDSAMESITELLSQLSGARRTNQHNSSSAAAQQTIQQLQMQLERQHSQSVARQHLEKLPSRSGASGGGGGSGTTRALSQPNATAMLSSQEQAYFAASSASGAMASSLAATDNSASANSQYLLARYICDSDPSESGESQRPPDRAQFVENLLLNSLLPNSALLSVRASQGTRKSQKKSLSHGGGSSGADCLEGSEADHVDTGSQNGNVETARKQSSDSKGGGARNDKDTIPSEPQGESHASQNTTLPKSTATSAPNTTSESSAQQQQQQASPPLDNIGASRPLV